MTETSNKPSQENQPGPGTARERCVCLRFLARVHVWLCRILTLALLLFIILLCTPLTEKLYAWLNVTESPTQADVIVCLGGRAGRLIWTVDAYQRGLAPRVIVSNLPSASHWMKKKLVQCGVPGEKIIVDPTSGTTADHPYGIARLEGINPKTQKFLVITDILHSRRVAACFRRAGFCHITIYGAGFPMRTDGSFLKQCRRRLLNLPNILYEYAALAQYWLQGKI